MVLTYLHFRILKFPLMIYTSLDLLTPMEHDQLKTLVDLHHTMLQGASVVLLTRHTRCK